MNSVLRKLLRLTDRGKFNGSFLLAWFFTINYLYKSKIFL
jgi:hypothetical protein